MLGKFDRVAALTALAIIAGCAAAAPDAPVPDAAELTLQGNRNSVEASVRAANAVEDGPYILPFWVNIDHPDVATLVDADAHPCGGVVRHQVTAIPEFPEGGLFFASTAGEYNTVGNPVREWKLPVDYLLLALDGDRVLIELAVPDERRSQYWIDPAGRISRAPVRIDFGQEIYEDIVECPARFGPAGAGVTCREMTDLGTGEPHRLSIEDVCT